MLCKRTKFSFVTFAVCIIMHFCTQASATNCWTCPSGYYHLSTITDPCACTKSPTTIPVPTTKKPSPTTPASKNCWTCPSGYSHWFTLGLQQPSDPCACLPSSSNPTSTTAPIGSYIKKLVAQMTPSSISTGSVSFADQVTPYAPWSPAPISLTKTLLTNLAKTTKFKNIMIYNTEPVVVGIAQSLGITVLGIIGLGTDTTENSRIINIALSTARSYPLTVLGLSCGNEMGNNYGPTAATAFIINSCLATLRAARIPQAIGVIDTQNIWYNNGYGWPAVSGNADFIGVNEYAWYQNYFATIPMTCQTPSNAAQTTLDAVITIEKMYPGKTILTTEFGWPGADNGVSIACPSNIYNGQVCSSANNGNQKVVVQGVIDLFRKTNRPCNTFEAYRESWKAIGTSPIEGQWGICLGTSPYTCINAPV